MTNRQALTPVDGTTFRRHPDRRTSASNASSVSRPRDEVSSKPVSLHSRSPPVVRLGNSTDVMSPKLAPVSFSERRYSCSARLGRGFLPTASKGNTRSFECYFGSSRKHMVNAPRPETSGGFGQTSVTERRRARTGAVSAKATKGPHVANLSPWR